MRGIKKSRELLIEQEVYNYRAKRLLWKKKRNFYINNISKAQKLRVNSEPFQRLGTMTLRVPKLFSTIIDIETVLRFIARCKKVQSPILKQLFFDLTNVEEINAGALSLLLSVTHDLESSKIFINGNLPKNEKARKAFIDSGFLDYYRVVNRSTKSSKSKILMKGAGQTDPEKTACELEEAMNTVFGKPSFNTPMQGAIIEMQANSVNHAFPEGDESNDFLNVIKQNKPWYLSASHDYDNKTVYFSFIDNGVGLINTLYRKFFQKAVDVFIPNEVLKNAFNGKYMSSTKLKERGRGLPRIKEAFDKGVMKELTIITNGYRYSFSDQ